MTIQSFAQTMAARAYFRELHDARSLGYIGADAYVRAFRVMDESYSAVFRSEQPFVWQEPKMICNRSQL